MLANHRLIISGLLVCCLSSRLFGQGLPTAKPESVGMASERLDKVTAEMQQFVDKKQVSGVVSLIARHGKVVYLSAVGKRDIAGNKPMTPDTLFRMFSMTKPITTVAIMMLVEEGKIRLSDPLSKFIPEFKDTKVAVMGQPDADGKPEMTLEPMKREITIEDLLSHKSGMTYSFFASPVASIYGKLRVADSALTAPPTLAENMKRLASAPLLFQPGAQWNYGLSTDTLGRVVEVASGMSLDRFFQERIFAPLQMHHTFFYTPDEELDNLAVAYSSSSDGLEAIPISFRGSKTYFSGGSGLIGAVGDYARFLQMLVNGGELDGKRLLKPQTVRMMLVSHTEGLPDSKVRSTLLGPDVAFCLGFARTPVTMKNPKVRSESYSYWWGGAFGTVFFWDPKNQLLGVALIQRVPSLVLTDVVDIRAPIRSAAYEAIMK